MKRFKQFLRENRCKRAYFRNVRRYISGEDVKMIGTHNDGRDFSFFMNPWSTPEGWEFWLDKICKWNKLNNREQIPPNMEMVKYTVMEIIYGCDAFGPEDLHWHLTVEGWDRATFRSLVSDEIRKLPTEVWDEKFLESQLNCWIPLNY